MRFNTLCLVIW